MKPGVETPVSKKKIIIIIFSGAGGMAQVVECALPAPPKKV
jgi:hypothetical protein